MVGFLEEMLERIRKSKARRELDKELDKLKKEGKDAFNEVKRDMMKGIRDAKDSTELEQSIQKMHRTLVLSKSLAESFFEEIKNKKDKIEENEFE